LSGREVTVFGEIAEKSHVTVDDNASARIEDNDVS
jgi:hypothetical protein